MTFSNGSAQHSFEAGEHHCFLFQTDEEQRSLVTLYLRDGLQRNEKVLYLADGDSKSILSDRLSKDGLEIESFLDRGQLLILQANDVFLSGGHFDPEMTIGWLKTETERAREQNYRTLRITYEMTWILQDEPGCERLIEFECMLDRIIPEISCVCLGQYDQRRFDPTLLLNVFAAHPKIMVGVHSYENPYYLAPNHSLRVEQPSETLKRWIDSLVSSRQAHESLRDAKEYAEKLIETANVMIVGLDENGNLQVFNEAAEKITGYDRTELKGSSWFETLVPKDRYPEVWEVFKNWRAGEYTTPQVHENPILTKSGKERFISWQNNKIEERGEFRGTISFGIDITDRIRVEKALRESEYKYREILESASEAIVIILSDGQIVFFNRKAEEIFGYGREEILGQNLEVLIPEVSRERHAQKLKYYFESPHLRPPGEGISELAGKHKSGRVFPAEIGLSFIDIGSERLAVGFISDIGERKEAERKLKLSDQILQSVGALVLVADADGKINYVSPSVKSILGYEPEELLGEGWWSLTRDEPLARDRERRFVTRSIGRQLPLYEEPYERMVTHRNGDPRWILWSDTSGSDGTIIGVGHDITLRKVAEEQLQKVMHAVEQSPNSVLITDTDGNIEYVNPKFSEVSGYSPEEVLGKNPRILKSGETQDEEYSFLWKTITSGGEWRGEFHNRRKDGELYWESASISPIKNAQGRVTHYVAIKEDITHRKNLEAQLRQAQKMEAVGTLAGGVAHDFNNLLTAINGYSEIVFNSLEPDDPLRRTIGEIRKAGDRAAALTRQLLAFSRKQVLLPKVLNLNEVISNLEDILRRLIGEDVQLIVQLDPDLGLTKADPGQIEQVVMNLAVNARDAMPQGGTLLVETVNVDVDKAAVKSLPGMRPGSYVMLVLIDTGCGMDAETQAHIFEPFFTTKDVGKGTGLGLSTAYGIIKQSGGCIYASSDVDQGCTFKVYLPRVDETVKPDNMPLNNSERRDP